MISGSNSCERGIVEAKAPEVQKSVAALAASRNRFARRFDVWLSFQPSTLVAELEIVRMGHAAAQDYLELK